MPKYYNELSESEKKMIILRKFEVKTYDSNRDSGLVLDILFSATVESFFYIASLDEVRAKSVAHIDDITTEYPDLFYSGALGNYSYDYSSNGMRKKTRENGSPGEYFVTTTRSYTNGAGAGCNLYVNVIDRDGGLFAKENETWERFDSARPISLFVSSGVVPFCDIKGDTIVEKDPDGYWRITEAPEDIPVEPPKIFGIQRDITNPSPEWTRTGDAVGMTATASVGNTAGRSDFDKCMPWAGMVRETLSTGDVMVKIPKFYYRRYREGNIEHIEIADKPVEGFSVHPSFNHTGQEKDFIYIGAYKTSSNNKSISGATPQVNQLRSVMRNNAHSKGEGWNIIDISALSAIQMLFLVEYATNDSQKAIGRGYVDGNSSILQTGTCDNVLNLTGVPTGTNGKVDVIYRGIEGLWGNIREWVDGINFNNREIWVCNNPSQYADDISTNYTKLSYNLINNTGYITELGIDQGENKHIMLPFNSGGSNSTYYPDYVNGNINNRTWRVLNISGGLQGNSDAGLFCSYCDFGSMNSHDRVGSRLLYIPSSIGHSGGISQ